MVHRCLQCHSLNLMSKKGFSFPAHSNNPLSEVWLATAASLLIAQFTGGQLLHAGLYTETKWSHMALFLTMIASSKLLLNLPFFPKQMSSLFTFLGEHFQLTDGTVFHLKYCIACFKGGSACFKGGS